MANDVHDDEAADAFDAVGLGSGGIRDLRKKPRQIGGTLPARTAREESVAGPGLDGRHMRHKGRRVQLNIKVRPEFKKMLEQIAKSRSSSMAEVIEWCVETYGGELDQLKSNDHG